MIHPSFTLFLFPLPVQSGTAGRCRGQVSALRCRWLFCCAAVSYTHLDVYKRQVRALRMRVSRSAIGSVICMPLTSFGCDNFVVDVSLWEQTLPYSAESRLPGRLLDAGDLALIGQLAEADLSLIHIWPIDCSAITLAPLSIFIVLLFVHTAAVFAALLNIF